MNELTDLGTLGNCAECETPIDGETWFWYADAGSAHLTFCQHHEPTGFQRVERATAIRLTDHRDGEEFVRVVKVPDMWFDGTDAEV
jgi:hypothetical protein